LSLPDFEEQLRTANMAALANITSDTSGIRREVAKLRKWLNDDREAQTRSDHLQAALLKFRSCGGKEEFAFPELRLVCAASPVTIMLGGKAFCLLADRDLLTLLLRQVSSYDEEPRRLRRLFRGLLNCYFLTDPDESSLKAEGWNRLASFLRERVHRLSAGSTQPRWVEVIQEHRNLLEPEPCLRYADDLLRGDKTEFSLIESELAIGGSSWIGRKVVWSLVKKAVEFDDAQFSRFLPGLLEKLEQERYASLLDECLAELLERHCRGHSKPACVELFAFAVRHWKNPWLAINAGRWGRVSEATRHAVAAWLKLDLIQQFFELLASDGKGDRRRLEFWIKYHECMDDMYFALGTHARRHPSKEFRELRNRLMGRVMSLSGAGGPDNNAFLMCFGDYIIVEFGNAGNACYVYQKSTGLPFSLEPSQELVGRGLKCQSNVLKLLHKDNVRGHGTWEQRFEASLYTDLQIRLSPSQIPAPWSFGQVYNDFSPNVLSAFCAAFNCTYQDRSGYGGLEWVTVGSNLELAAKQLKSWGFRRSTSPIQWYR
jgi:hypothetical protein